jgi:hypothetical protein
MDKKRQQLGMNPSTASGKLLKDLLFDFAVKAGHVCYRCEKNLLRDNFSIEHKIPWLDSINPIELFFSIDNIAYSHLDCNIRYARKNIINHKHGTRGRYKKGCVCALCREAEAGYRRSIYTTEKRRRKKQ